MKNVLMILMSMNILMACSSNENDEFGKELKLREMLNSGVESLKRRTNNFNIYEGSYISAEKEDSNKTKFQKTPVNFFSAVEMNIYDVLNMLQEHYSISSYMSDLHSLDAATQEEALKLARAISFKGTMEDFLAYLGGAYGVDMSLNDKNVLDVKFFVTKTYGIDQYLDGAKSTTSISIGGGEGTSGGLSGTSESSVETNTWDKIEEYLDKVIGTDGRVTILQDFSIVNITARPWIFKEVDQLFDRLKKESQMQVAVQYRVISLSKSKLDQLAVKFGINEVTSDGYTIISDIVDAISLTKVGGGLAVNDSTVSSRLDAIVESLSQDVISKGQFVGLPNRVMPINLTTSKAYVQEVTRETDDTTGDIFQKVVPGEIITGLSILILPKVLDDGRVQLTSGFTEKRLVIVENFNGIQLPEVDETETLSTVTLDSGTIELIALYSENNENKSKRIQLLGAGTETLNEDRIIAVLVGADSYKLSSSISKRG